MIVTERRAARLAVWRRHAWRNRAQTLLLVLTLLAIGTAAGGVLFGDIGLWLALGACLLALVIEPAAAARLTLALYRARPIDVREAPELWEIAEALARRAELPAAPVLYLAPSAVSNAFAVGNRDRSGIVLSHRLLASLTLREIVGVLAHETAHIVHGDLRVMGLADYVSRLTSLLALVGQMLALFALPGMVLGVVDFAWSGLLLLLAAPYLALLTQLGLSRVREFDADLGAVALTGDPQGLASALAKIEGVSRSWKRWVLPGWGNPDPSWLRSHPATEERIERLLDLAGPAGSPPPWAAGTPRIVLRPAPRVPRWHVGGLWR